MGKIGAIADGAAEDLIRAFQQLACAEGHYKTLVEKYESELNNGIVDVDDNTVVRAHVEKMNDTIDELNEVAEARRAIMLQVMNAYPDASKDMWCSVKHLSVASYCAFEAYQASDNDAALLNLWLSSHARFVKAITRWLGTEISDCAACLGDILKQKGEQTNEPA